MTISSTTRKAGPFLGNGATTTYPFTFKVFAASDLQVVRTDAAGADTTLTLNSQYSIALNADQNAAPGGTITYPIVGGALAGGEKLTVISVVPATQPADLGNAGRFLPEVVENALDRDVMLYQQLADKLGRALLFPVSDSLVPGTLPTKTLLASKFLAFDASGNPVASSGTGADAGLRTDLAASGGAGLVGYIQTGTGAVARTLQGRARDILSVNDFSTVQAAFTAVPTGTLESKVVYFPAGQYSISAGITAVGRNIIVAGAGQRASLLVVSAGVTAIALDATGCPAACIGVQDMGILESGAQVAMTGISFRNSGDVFLQDVYITTSGRALDIGSSAGDVVFTMMSQVRIECYGGKEAIRFRCGGGCWSNVYCRKARSGGVTGPCLWWSGQSTSLEVSNSVFAGKGTAVSLKILQINAGVGFFDAIATGAGLKFTAGETLVIRGTGTGYDATWKVGVNPDADTVRVLTAGALGNLTPANAFVDKLHAVVYMDNTFGAVNESLWSNVLFEGIDDGGSAGGTGSVSLYVDATGGAGSIGAHQFNTCTFDAGQTCVYMNGKHVGGGDYLISDFRYIGCIGRYVKNGFYFKEVRGITITGFASDCIRSHGTAAELLNSACIYLDGLGFQAIQGITLANSNFGRQASYHLGSISSFSPDYGIRLGGSPTDMKWTGCHFFGLTGAVLIDSATVLPTATRLVDTDSTYASGAGGETNATRIPNIASAASITMPFGDVFGITGTTGVSTILNGWVGRKVQFYTGSAVTFSTGGNISVALTTVAGQLITGLFDGTNWHLR